MIEVRIDGLQKALADIKRAGTVVDKALQAEKAELAAVVAEQERRTAPTLSGNLRDSIEVQEDGDDYVVRTGVGLDYAAAVEYGTEHTAPNGFVRRAAVYGRREMEQRSGQRIGREVERRA